MEKEYKYQKALRGKMMRGQCLEKGTSDFCRVEKFLRRHPGRKLGKVTKIYADYGAPYDNSKRTKHLCWWVLHDLALKPEMVGQKACRNPRAYLKQKKNQEKGIPVLAAIKKAMRVAVQSQIEEFRMSFIPGTR